MNTATKMTLQNHLGELRRRLFISAVFFIITFGACYFFASEIYNFLLQPLVDIFNHQQNRRLIYTSPAEAFITYLKLSFYSALLS